MEQQQLTTEQQLQQSQYELQVAVTKNLRLAGEIDQLQTELANATVQLELTQSRLQAMAQQMAQMSETETEEKVETPVETETKKKEK